MKKYIHLDLLGMLVFRSFYDAKCSKFHENLNSKIQKDMIFSSYACELLPSLCLHCLSPFSQKNYPRKLQNH